MTTLHSTAQIRDIETAHEAKRGRVSLMARAGAAVAREALAMLPKRKDAAILVLAGPGNNGGDAWVAAEALRKAGQRVSVWAIGAQKFADPASKAAHASFVKGKGKIVNSADDHATFDLIVDGLFGIGLKRAPEGAFADAIEWVNAQAAPVLAIDIPSGLNADTGCAAGLVIRAGKTVTFIGAKPGLYTGLARDVCGAVRVDALGLKLAPTACELLTPLAMAAVIPTRAHASHKGRYGNVAVVGGAEGMVGAVMLAARAALMMGPGKVYAGFATREIPPYDPINPELMLRRADELIDDKAISALAIGMGLGTDKTAPRLLSAALARQVPMVIDADALNILSQNPSIGAAFQAKMAQTARPSTSFIFTPHPGEAARLLGTSTMQIESDRVAAAKQIAVSFACIAVLKGSGTVLAHPDGRTAINPTGNPGMASGGMGDALSGMIAAFLAMGVPAWDAARLAVYLHGAAADACIDHGMAPHGLTASEVIFEARTLLNAGLVSHEHG
jgi:hydroxyethylthiazole kinase-like uncharacterized protein yjeF